MTHYKIVVVGGSAGGGDALKVILSQLPVDFSLPILVVQHLHSSDGGLFAKHLADVTTLAVIEPCDKDRIEPGHIYTAPSNYHMMVEKEGSIALCVNEKVNWSRPSIDVLFQSASRFWGDSVIGVILSGANTDGARGLKEIREKGGLTIAQEPSTAAISTMPQAAIDLNGAREVLTPPEIGLRLMALAASG